MVDVKQFYEQLERDGEEQVRRTVATHSWGKEHHGLAVAWLEARAESRREASNAEHRRIARSAKNAAWAAAIAAIIAAIIAIVATVISWLALKSG